MLPAHAGMVPWGSGATWCHAGAPRARGDGPAASSRPPPASTCSPRTRGWSREAPVGPGDAPVLPAHAGMVPATGSPTSRPPRAPRARGDGPREMSATRSATPCSPRTRGWSLLVPRSVGQEHVLPAHAGMVPAAGRSFRSVRSAPRARGDGPRLGRGRVGGRGCSPRTRGWSRPCGGGWSGRGVLPAHAGMVPTRSGCGPSGCCAPRARGDGPTARWNCCPWTWCSPRTRGWSQGLVGEVARGPVLPAHAGMVPVRPEPAASQVRAPRARGDGPVWSHALTDQLMCSPRTRGWSPRPFRTCWCPAVLPAHAGMVPGGKSFVTPGPRCSPRTRGWSLSLAAQEAHEVVLPAHAGMVPEVPARITSPSGAPRARGDGPSGEKADGRRPGCSPRTRGWSRSQRGPPVAVRVLPAHAGMVPKDSC